MPGLGHASAGHARAPTCLGWDMAEHEHANRNTFGPRHPNKFSKFVRLHSRSCTQGKKGGESPANPWRPERAIRRRCTHHSQWERRTHSVRQRGYSPKSSAVPPTGTRHSIHHTLRPKTTIHTTMQASKHARSANCKRHSTQRKLRRRRTRRNARGSGVAGRSADRAGAGPHTVQTAQACSTQHTLCKRHSINAANIKGDTNEEDSCSFDLGAYFGAGSSDGFRCAG